MELLVGICWVAGKLLIGSSVAVSQRAQAHDGIACAPWFLQAPLADWAFRSTILILFYFILYPRSSCGYSFLFLASLLLSFLDVDLLIGLATHACPAAAIHHAAVHRRPFVSQLSVAPCHGVLLFRISADCSLVSVQRSPILLA